jgi:hypothetical protein
VGARTGLDSMERRLEVRPLRHLLHVSDSEWLVMSDCYTTRSPDLDALAAPLFFVPQEVNWQPRDASCNLLWL